MSKARRQGGLPKPRSRARAALRSFGTLAFVFVATLGLAFALGGSPDWHKHLQAGAELFHAHGYFGAHTHPPGGEGHGGQGHGSERHGESPSGPAESPAETPTDSEESGEATEFLALSGPGSEASTEWVAFTAILAEASEVDSDPTVPTVRRRAGPRSSRAPPLSIV